MSRLLFPVSDELAETLSGMRAFVRERLLPLEAHFVGAASDEPARPLAEQIEALRDEVRERGWWGPQIPASLGGMGLDLMAHARVSEELGYTPLGHYIFGCQAPDAGNLEILHDFGSAEQKARWLLPLAKGEIRSCFAMTEPEHAGSNPVIMSTTAVLDGDEWVINGHKWFASSADGAAFAIVMAVTDPDADRYARASMIVVPTDTPGYELVRNIPVMGDVGHDYGSHGEIRLSDCRVPKANLLGGRGAGFMIAQQRLGPGRIHHCMRWIGIAERAFDMMCRRAVERELVPGKPLASRQTIQNWIAESRVEIDASRMLVLQAAARVDEVGSYGARVEISMIKYYVASVMLRVIDQAIQVHGALGVTDDTILSWLYRHERAARIYDGPDEVHKYVVARRILREYGSTK